MKETGTLGIRIIPTLHRGVANREIVTKNIQINNSEETVHFKIGYMNDEIIKCTPEYEDIKKLSDKTSIPVKDLMNLAKAEYIRLSGSE